MKEQNINKGFAITKLLEYLSMPLNDIVVVGNDLNDIEMFRLNIKEKILVSDSTIFQNELRLHATKILSQKELLTYIVNLTNL